MVRSAGVRLSDSALRTSGRFSVMMATRSRITHNSSLVPVSMVISVVMFPHLLLFFVIARSEATKQSSFLCVARWIASLRSHHDGNVSLSCSQNFSTHGRNSSSQVQALRGCCSTFQ